MFKLAIGVVDNLQLTSYVNKKNDVEIVRENCDGIYDIFIFSPRLEPDFDEMINSIRKDIRNLFGDAARGFAKKTANAYSYSMFLG